MPPVPQASEPEVKDAPISGVKATADATLAAFGGGEEAARATNEEANLADQSAGIFFEKAKQEKELQDVTANYGAAAQLSQLQVGLINDAKSKQGVNAEGIYAPTMEAYRKGASGIERTLQTPEQKAAFQRQMFSHQVELDRVLQDHVSGQRIETAKQTVAASTITFENGAITKALTDPYGSELDLKRAQASRMEHAKVAGLTPDSTKLFLEDGESAARLKVLEAYITSGQDLVATKYFEDHKDAFKRGDLIQAQERVESSSVRGESSRVIDEAWDAARHSGDVVSDGPTFKTESDAVGWAKTFSDGKDPRVQEAVENKARKRFADELASQNETRVQDYSSAFKLIQKTNDMQSVYDQGLDKNLSPSELENLERYTLAKARPPKTVDDRDAVTKLSFVSDRELSQWSPSEPLKYFDKLTKSSYDHLLDRIEKARKKDDSVQYKPTEPDEKLILEAAKSVGIGGIRVTDSKEQIQKNPSKNTAYAAFREDVLSELAANTNDKGEIPKWEDRKTLIKEMASKKKPSSFWEWLGGGKPDKDELKQNIPELTAGGGFTVKPIAKGDVKTWDELIEKAGGKANRGVIYRKLDAAKRANASMETLWKIAGE